MYMYVADQTILFIPSLVAIIISSSLQKFFRLTNLRKLTVSENDIVRIPPGIANLTKLVEFDISKNGEVFIMSVYDGVCVK